MEWRGVDGPDAGGELVGDGRHGRAPVRDVGDRRRPYRDVTCVRNIVRRNHSAAATVGWRTWRRPRSPTGCATRRTGVARRRRDARVARLRRHVRQPARALEADLAPHGLTIGDYEVLVRLSEAAGPPDADVRPRRAAAPVARAASRAASTASSAASSSRREPSAARPPGDARRPHRRRASPLLAAAAPTTSRSVREHFLDRLDARPRSSALGGSVRQGPRRGLARPRPADWRSTHPTRLTAAAPPGFRAHVANIGIKDDTDDFVVVAAERPCAAAGVFTRSSFAGPSVVVSREHARRRGARARSS